MKLFLIMLTCLVGGPQIPSWGRLSFNFSVTGCKGGAASGLTGSEVLFDNKLDRLAVFGFRLDSSEAAPANKKLN